MKIYLVGGAARDQLLGLEPKDKDYVVVGSTPEEMISLGYIQVGKDFPVFLHPETKEEYALARTEKKVGEGHTGFVCEWEGVTLEEDLSRRDLTINAIAQDLDTGEYIDPEDGIDDIRLKLLSATGEAFQEDPLRVLRVARLMSRYGPEWVVCGYTEMLMREMYRGGFLDSLTPERVWKEMEKALSESYPSLFFKVLAELGVEGFFEEWYYMEDTPQRLDHHPEKYVDIHTSLVMDFAAKKGYSSEEIFACFTHDFGKPICYNLYNNAHGHENAGLPIIEDFCDKWKVPNKYRELALLVCEYHTKIHGCMGRSTNKKMRAKSIMKLFEATGAIKKPERFYQILNCCKADAAGRGSTLDEIKEFENKPYPQAQYLRDCLEAALQVDTKSISKKLLQRGTSGVNIGLEIRSARISAIREVQKLWNL
jgi:tRNA nucleotidyltransferase (CCA-adding enzyme)